MDTNNASILFINQLVNTFLIDHSVEITSSNGNVARSQIVFSNSLFLIVTAAVSKQGWFLSFSFINLKFSFNSFNNSWLDLKRPKLGKVKDLLILLSLFGKGKLLVQATHPHSNS